MDGLSSGAISGWPRAMIVVSHYSVAELTALKDFTDLKNKFDNVQKTFVSISETFNCTLYDNSRNPKPVTLRLLDTLLLVPGQSRGLEALGDLHNIPKVELGRESKSNMLGLLHTDPELFKRYAIRDAVSNVSALGTH